MEWQKKIGVLFLWISLCGSLAMAQEKQDESNSLEPETNQELNVEERVKRPQWYVVNQMAVFFGKKNEETEKNTVFSPSLHLSGGYSFKNWLQTGVGVGYDVYGNTAVFPVFAEVRGEMAKRGNFGLYYALKAGDSFASIRHEEIKYSAKGGLMTEFQAGLSIGKGSWSWLIGGGYHTQKVSAKGELPDWWGPTFFEENRNYRRLLISSSFRLTF